MQGDLLGAAALGIKNVLCLTGDDVTAGDQPEAKRVFDFDSLQLLRTAAHHARPGRLSQWAQTDHATPLLSRRSSQSVRAAL